MGNTHSIVDDASASSWAEYLNPIFNQTYSLAMYHVYLES